MVEKVYAKKNNPLYILVVLFVIFALVKRLFFISIGSFNITGYRVVSLICFPFLVLYVLKKLSVYFDYQKYQSVLIVLCWFAYSMLSFLWAENKFYCLRANLFLMFGFSGFILVLCAIDNENKLLNVFKLIEVILFLHICIGFFEVVFGRYLFLDEFNSSVYAANRMPVTMFGNTNDFALFLNIGFFVSYICFKCDRELYNKIFDFICMFGSVVLLIFTRSRANYLGLVVAVFVMCFIQVSKYKKLIFDIFYAVVFMLVLAILVFFFRFSAWFGDYGVASVGVRINLIKNGIEFCKDYFFAGVGAGNIEYMIDEHAVYSTGGILSMHNYWLEILVSYGLIIFVLFAGLFICNIVKCIRIYFDSKVEYNAVGIILAASLISFSIGALSSSNAVTEEWSWLFLGLVSATVNIYCLEKSYKERIKR